MDQVADTFIKGMGAIELFPNLPHSTALPSRSPWEGVAASFTQTGANMRAAMEYFDAQLKPKPTK